VHHIIYLSHATRPIDSAALDRILETSRRNNPANGITGLLIHRGGNFIQYLEGEEPDLRRLYATICADPRHAGTTVLSEGPIPRRQFTGWTMNFRQADGREIFSPEELEDDPEGFRTLLKAFSENLR
jgi:hypothetical protein